MRLAPDRFCNAIEAWCRARLHKEEDLAQWEFRLNEPPPDTRVTETVIAAEMDAFADFATAFGVKKPVAR